MIKIFTDFDGTITKQDVGDSMFVAFGGKRCLGFIEEYRNGRISAIECFMKECASCGGTDRKELDSFIDSQEIDGTFKDFTAFCRSNGIEYMILSDGMDYYLDRIISRHTEGGAPFRTNHLELVPLNGAGKVDFLPSFPFTDEVCDRCACCKRNHMLTLSGDEDIIIYIGEGYSDRCPVHYADLVFAKDELLKYCQENNISYFEYRTFADIIERLEILLKKPALKKRRQALLAAREIYLGG